MLETNDYPLTTSDPVQRAVMLQRWERVTFVHWQYDPSVVQSRLPAGLVVDTFEGSAWIGLVAFHMRNIRLPYLPPVPYLGSFPETNVRTYVRGPDGRPGVWFDSLDVTRLIPVLVAQGTYRLPYRWSKMSIRPSGTTITYSTTTRWPGSPGVTSRLAVRPGRPIIEMGALERFLTARWGLYSRLGRTSTYAPVDHPAWPLHEADLVDLDDRLVAAAGYPEPHTEPLVHFSPGVPVRVGLPRRIER